jgi:hypothetical protein
MEEQTFPYKTRDANTDKKREWVARAPEATIW